MRMDPSSRLFKRRRTVHEILGGGMVADLVLWRHKTITRWLLCLTSATWFVFKGAGYTFLSFTSSVLLLCLSILFFWAKSAAILRRYSTLIINRPIPPLPRLHVSEDLSSEVAVFVREKVNDLLSTSYDIALGKNTKLFVQVFTYLLLIRMVAGLTDLLTLSFIIVIIGLTLPVLYEKFEDCIDRQLINGYEKIHIFSMECIHTARRCSFEKHKLC